MDLHQRCPSFGGLRRGATPGHRVIVVAASKPNKGFGTAQKSKNERSTGGKGEGGNDKQVVQEAAGATRQKYRPIRAEEAARGKLDYVQVADWGSGERDKLGELRLVSHVAQYEGGAAASGSGTSSSSSSGSSGGGDGKGDAGPRPFHMQLANQLKMAESRGALAIAGPPPPPLSEWSFQAGRYCQYLRDQLEVHLALDSALLEATAAVAATTAADDDVPSAPPAAPAASSAPAPHSQQPPPQPPAQCAVRALLHVAPGRLGLERSAALQRDLAALHATADHPAALEARRAAATAPTTAVAGVTARVGSTSGREEVERAAAEQTAAAPSVSGSNAVAAEGIGREAGAQARVESGSAASAASGAGAAEQRAVPAGKGSGAMAGPMARSYGQYLRRLGRDAAGAEKEQERQSAALRLLAHSAVLHMVGQAAGVRLGATATERLGLLQRRAAATYHDFPESVRDPRVTLSSALDAAGEHLRSPTVRQMVFDEMPSAMQKTGLLMTALAHRD